MRVFILELPTAHEIACVRGVFVIDRNAVATEPMLVGRND